jgi:hypothetical protein
VSLPPGSRLAEIIGNSSTPAEAASAIGNEAPRLAEGLPPKLKLDLVQVLTQSVSAGDAQLAVQDLLRGTDTCQEAYQVLSFAIQNAALRR